MAQELDQSARASREWQNTPLQLHKEEPYPNITAVSDDANSAGSDGGRSTHVPMRMKLIAVLMVSLIGFGSHWSSGVTGAMKSTLKKVTFVFQRCRKTSLTQWILGASD